MNKRLQSDNKLLFKHEVLRARLGVRDFFLKNTIKEVYENIGQVLSVVRMQLAVLDVTDNTTEESKSSPSLLVGQSIKDLRSMCKSFYPDEEILKDKGFTEALKETICIVYDYNNPVIKIKGLVDDLQPGLKLIVFKMLQELLISTKENGGKFISLAISQIKESRLKFTISCTSKKLPTLQSTEGEDTELTMQQRAQLIKGQYKETTTGAGVTHIKLVSPLNCFYEKEHECCIGG